MFATLGAIDRIGAAFCQSAQDLQRIADIQRYRSFRMRCLATTLSLVDGCGVPIHATVSVRLKRLDSIRRKIGRAGTNFSLGRLDDVIGVRVICQDLHTVEEFSHRIQASPSYYRAKDYIANPAGTGYRGINHILRFQQPIGKERDVHVRFEVQARTYLQHRWAVWSEAQGEAVKLGVGSVEEKARLRELSEKIAQWEERNPKTSQVSLPTYSGGQSIAVCWRIQHGPVTPYYFLNQVQNAVDWLNHLETTYPGERENALLLVGVTDTTATERLLQLTHPLFTGTRVIDPRHWMPQSG